MKKQLQQENIALLLLLTMIIGAFAFVFYIFDSGKNMMDLQASNQLQLTESMP